MRSESRLHKETKTEASQSGYEDTGENYSNE
jgi:hypothetical protein